MPSFIDFLFGPDQKGSMSTLTKEQQSALSNAIGQFMQQSGQYGDIGQNQTYQAGNSYVQGLLNNDPESFKHFEAPYMRQFNEQTAPGIAERYAGAGALNSSAFRNSITQAGAGLSENLAAQRGQLQMSALGQALQYAQQPFNNMMQYGQMGLGTQAKENYYMQGNGGFLGGLGQAYLGGGGMR